MRDPAAAEVPAGINWPMLVPLLADFWHIVCTRLDKKSRAGRLKQWLNFLRRRFPEAETAYQALKTINDTDLIDEWLSGLMRERPFMHPCPGSGHTETARLLNSFVCESV